ncbi:MAG: DNA polymerase III subunit delta [Rickettsiales bacterium]|nr:DNA polymerase III subunit delta [Rickettsiales bacterium]
MKLQAYKIQEYIKNIANEQIAGCLLYGPEESVITYRFNFIAKKIVSDLKDPFLVSNISKERLKEDESILADEFYSMSMMGGRKLIMVKDCDNSVAESLKAIFMDDHFYEKSNNFILIQGSDLGPTNALRKLAETNNNFVAIPCYEDDEKTIIGFIEALLKNKKIIFNKDVILLLLEKFGKNRQIIISEIEKISTYLGNNNNLDIDTVEKLVKLESEVSADEFVLLFANKDYEKAVNNCEKLFRDNFEPIALIRYLVNYLLKLQMAKIEIEKDGVTIEEAVKNQRLFFKVENNFKRHVSDLSLEFINGSLKGLAELELKIKSGAVNAKLVFLRFVQGRLMQ